jgi:NAD(P)-dependent dehydrogenase (short-subunit alcohol dehydrogenase family)
MELDLKGKVSVITGGSSGIGLAVARGLAAGGVHLALCARDGKRLTDAVGSIRKEFGVSTLGVPTDVTKPVGIEKFISMIEKEFGGADILINNAGFGSEETIMGAPDER